MAELREAGIVGSGTLVSRLLGLIRDQIFAALLGAGHLADAFQLAFRAPHLLRDLLGEGALSGGLTPAIAKARERAAAEGFALADRIGLWLLLVVGASTGLAMIFAPALVGAIAGDFGAVAGKQELTARLLRIMLPFVPLVVVAAVSMSVLHATGHTAAPAFASASFNLAAIVVAGAGWLLGARGPDAALVWAFGTLAGGVAQVAIQLPALWRSGYRPAWRPGLTPEARRVLVAFLPAVVGLAAMQVNLFVAMGFASGTAGATSQLAYAFRFLQLPIGLSAVAVGVVSSVAIARAAAAGRGAAAEAAQGIRLVAFVALPASVGLWLLATPIVRLVFERGAFGPGDTLATAAALRAYATGILAYGVVKVLAPALYALGRVRWALFGAAASIAANAIWCARAAGPGELAMGATVGSSMNAAILVAAMADAPFLRALAGLAWPLARMALASAACGAAAWLSFDPLGTLGACAVGALVYAAACLVLRLDELRSIFRR